MTGGTAIGGAMPKLELAAGVLAAALTGVLLGSGRAEAGGGSFALDPVGEFNQPVDVRQAPGEPDLLFVVEKAGKIRVVEGGEILAKAFLNIKKRVSSSGEEGLLSLAFHPNYERNRRFYVFYVNTDTGHDVEVDQFKRRKGSAVRAIKRSRKQLIVVQHNQANNHNGGQLQFAPGTKHLYISIGDGGPQGDPENDAQKRTRLLGKLLRIIPRGGGDYDVPADNPFLGRKGRKQIYARGLRNPFRFSFDSENGALTIGDVGGTDWEEVNYVADPDPGLNFGWNDFEGMHETTFGIPPLADPHTPPIHEYANDAATCAITGGYVVRDPDLPALDGQYVFADFCEGELRAIQVPSGAAGQPIGLDAGNPSSFGEGLDGQIYVVSLGGGVFALESAP